jgi:heat shock protein HslJ
MRRALVVMTLVVLGLAAGCGDDRSMPAAAKPALSLDGRTFLSQSLTENGVDRARVSGTQIQLTFEGGSLRATAGCNTLGARYSVDGGVLVLVDGAQTAIGCDQARSAQDEWLFGALTKRPAVTVSADSLVLVQEGFVMSLREETASPDRPLVGGRWNLSSILSGAGAEGSASSVPGEAWIEFGADGTWTAKFPCNSGGGRFELAGDRLTVTAGVHTLMGCTDGRDQLDAQIIATLNAKPQVTIDRDRLSLRTGTGGLDFEAAN